MVTSAAPRGPAAYTPDVAADPAAGRRSTGFRPDVEGLRGIAVLLVVAYHAGLSRISGGFVGVDVFFVLSGYLITDILVGQVSRTGRLDYVQFYARRMRRLLPAVTLTLLVTLVAEWLAFGPMERIELSLSAVATALYSSNVFFLARAVDYFSAAADKNPLLHTWSLAVEEQFYVVWPWLVLLGWKLGRSKRGLGILMAAFSAASLLGCVWLTRKAQPWAFFGTPARAWEFGLGGLATLLPAMPAMRPALRWLGWVGLLLVVATAVALGPSTPFPGVVALVPTLGTALALVAGAQGDPHLGVGRVLTLRPLQWIGGRSYSWYLWHWPALVLGAALWPGMPSWGRLALAAGSLVLAALTTALIENPIRFLPRLVARPRLSIAIGAACTVGAAAIAFVAWRDASARGGAYWRAAHDVPLVTTQDCTTDFTETRPRQCTFGDPASKTTVVLLGDSHAVQWFPAFDRIARDRHWKLVTLVKYSCPAARVPMYTRVLKRLYTECAAWREQALGRVLAMRPAALVVGQFARKGGVSVRPDGALDSLSWDAWRDGLHSTLVTLDSAGVPTLLLRDSPGTGRDIPVCLSRAEHRGQPTSTCAVPRDRALDPRAGEADRAASAGLAHVTLLDLSDRMCDAATCEPLRDGVVVYRDNNHLSDAFVRTLTPALDAPLAALVAGR